MLFGTDVEGKRLTQDKIVLNKIWGEIALGFLGYSVICLALKPFIIQHYTQNIEWTLGTH